jgi:hypothetical protein
VLTDVRSTTPTRRMPVICEFATISRYEGAAPLDLLRTRILLLPGDGGGPRVAAVAVLSRSMRVFSTFSTYSIFVS